MRDPDAARRAFLRACAAAGVGGLLWPARGESPTASDLCVASGATALPVAGASRWFARLAPQGAAVTLRAGAAPSAAGMPFAFAYAATAAQQAAFNPTLVVERGERVRIDLVNALETEPTIVHWHGLANATANDGAGFALAQPGERYAYDFTIRNRAGLYWYHPHPHGLAAGQAYRGLFGLIEVQDDEDRALRRALDLSPGTTEIALALQDRRGPRYAPSRIDLHHGHFGDRPYVNGVAEPFVEVGTRIYRLRILNASNARTYKLGVRSGDGRPLPFTLIGTDGGLLAQPVACDACFLATAERVDLLLDLRGRRVGETVVLETRPFDPLHGEPPRDADAAPGPAADHGMAVPPSPAADASAHAAWAEGAAHDLLAFRVRGQVPYRREIPATLSALPRIAVDDDALRPFRLGFNKGRWRINDRVFAAGETPIEVRRGAREAWLIRNYHTSMPHAMHLHGVQFQVLERETSPDFLAPLAVHGQGRLATDLGWKDTVLVWPGESVRVAIDFALPFDGPQTYLFHCHNLEHEDGGMMLGVRVA